MVFRRPDSGPALEAQWKGLNPALALLLQFCHREERSDAEISFVGRVPFLNAADWTSFCRVLGLCQDNDGLHFV
jgi:hypothetical protein